MDWNYYAGPGIRVFGITNTNQDLRDMINEKPTYHGYCNSFYCQGNKARKYGIEKVVSFTQTPTHCPDCNSKLLWSID